MNAENYFSDGSLDLGEDVLWNWLREVDTTNFCTESGMQFNEFQVLLVRHGVVMYLGCRLDNGRYQRPG